jgi:uncharacterized protein
MKQSEYDNRYWNMITHEAARDPDLRNVVRWVCELEVVMVPSGSADEPDYAEVMAQIRDKYGITPEEVSEAFAICEQAVHEEATFQEPGKEI